MLCVKKNIGKNKRVQVREGETSASAVVPETLFDAFAKRADSMHMITKRAVGVALYLFLKTDDAEIDRLKKELWKEYYEPLEASLEAQSSFGRDLGAGLSGRNNEGESGDKSRNKPAAG